MRPSIKLSNPSGAARSYRRRIALALLLAAAVWGAAAAWTSRWTADDAFISYRYAWNLVEGRGLVYNEGEYVEGYTNPLWTLWVAAGLALGSNAETWTDVWSVAAYVGSILLLGLNGRRLAHRSGSSWPWLPLAALAAAFHRDWNVWATGGLETSAFTFLLLAAWTLAVWNPDRLTLLGAAGVVAALAALTRHDGVLLAALVGAYLLLWARHRWSSILVYGVSFMVVWVPFSIWRVAYYGDFFPTTYYAKSASLAWYGQGLLYLGMYLEKYWIVLVGPVLLLVAPWIGGSLRDATPAAGQTPQTALRATIAAGAFGFAYVLYVVRVGGDFMFARMLVPATPFLLLLFEDGCRRAFRGRAELGTAVGLLAVAGMVFSPAPISGVEFRNGVANERDHYAEEIEELDHAAEVLRPYFEGLPARIAFFGGEARVAYKARFPVAIECGGSLTEPEIARSELAERGRPGHEKFPSAEYLIERRRAHFTFARAAEEQLHISRFIPRVHVQFGEDQFGRVLHWDPDLMRALRARGARVPDIGQILEAALRRFPELSPVEREELFTRLDRFYFRPVGDPEREAAFRRLL